MTSHTMSLPGARRGFGHAGRRRGAVPLLVSLRQALTPRQPQPEPDSPLPQPAPDEVPANPTPTEIPPRTPGEVPRSRADERLSPAPLQIHY